MVSTARYSYLPATMRLRILRPPAWTCSTYSSALPARSSTSIRSSTSWATRISNRNRVRATLSHNSEENWERAANSRVFGIRKHRSIYDTQIPTTSVAIVSQGRYHGTSHAANRPVPNYKCRFSLTESEKRWQTLAKFFLSFLLVTYFSRSVCPKSRLAAVLADPLAILSESSTLNMEERTAGFFLRYRIQVSD